MKNLVDSLMMSSMKKNYADFVWHFGFEDADRRMGTLFGELFWENKETIWQWYDNESVFKEDIVCINEEVK